MGSSPTENTKGYRRTNAGTYLASQSPCSERYRFSLSRAPRITTGMTSSAFPAKTMAYSAAASGNSAATMGTELTLRLNS